METKGSGDNMMTLALDPGKRTNTIIYTSMPAMVIPQIERREGPFAKLEKPYTTLRAVALASGRSDMDMLTLDKDIKTFSDLKGKGVAVMLPGKEQPLLSPIP